MALSRKNRLADRDRIKEVLKHGTCLLGRGCKLYFLKSDQKEARVAIIVSKKVNKLATGRNKIRRVASEYIDKKSSLLGSGYDVVLYFQKSEKPPLIKEVLEGVEGVCNLFEIKSKRKTKS